jgi:hypothetical protein
VARGLLGVRNIANPTAGTAQEIGAAICPTRVTKPLASVSFSAGGNQR